jgi:putative peptidoglycan lipid II flippase
VTDPAISQRPAISLRSLGAPAVLLTVAGLLGQAFAVIRTLFIAARVGTSPELDALLVAEVLPVVAAGLLVSGLRTALVPAYMELADEHGERHAQRFVGAIISWTVVIGMVGVALLVLFPAVAVDIAGPGLSPSTHEAAMRFQPLMAPILVLSAVATLMGTLCQANGRYLPIALSLGTAPLVSLLITVLFWSQLGLNGLAAGMTLGYVGGLIVTTIYVARVGLLPPIAFTLDLKQLGRFLHHALPLTLGGAVLQFNLLADRSVATVLAPGAVSALNYGQQIVLLPLGSLSTAWTTVLYPSLVRAAQSGRGSSLGDGASRAVRYTIVLFVPIAIGVATLAPLLVEVVYLRGAFDAHSAALTAGVVAAFAPMLALTMIQPVVTGSHNARRRGALLGFTALINATLNIVLNLSFGLPLGVAGVALSTSVTTVVTTTWLASWLSRKEAGFAVKPALALMVRVLVASLVPAIPLSIIAWGLLPVLPLAPAAAVLVAMLFAGMLGYLASSWLLGITEIGDILGGLRKGIVGAWSRR